MPRYGWTYGDKTPYLFDYKYDLSSYSEQKEYKTKINASVNGCEQRTRSTNSFLYKLQVKYVLNTKDRSNFISDLSYCSDSPLFIPLYKYPYSLSSNYTSGDGALYLNGYLKRFHRYVIISEGSSYEHVDINSIGSNRLNIEPLINNYTTSAVVYPLISASYSDVSSSEGLHDSIISLTLTED